MIPILYEANETHFISNGIGRLRDCISAEVCEERNGVYELDFSYPIDGTYFDEILPGRIVCVTHNETDDLQPFDIVSYEKPIDGVATFHAVHISYRQSFMTVTGTNITSLADALNLLETATPSPNVFDYSADFTMSGNLGEADGLPHTVREMLGGVEGSILDVYGGEYEWDKFSVILHRNRGQMRDFAVRYGINMLDYNDEADYFGAFTSCVPFWKSGDDLVSPVVGNKVDSGLPTYCGRDLCVPLDLSDKFENAPTTAQLEAEALSYMRQKQTNQPSQTIKIDFIRLQDFAGYEDLSSLLKCSLCDTIMVEFPQYKTSGTFKIVRTVWDVLGGRYIEMELGSLSTSLSEALGISGGTAVSGGGSGAPTFTTITPSSGSTISGQECYYAKVGYVVTVNIALEGLTANSTASITTLPSGYRPRSKVTTIVQAGSRSAVCTMEIGTDGAVTIATHASAQYALGTVSFIVE